jgi:hypothetical protein
MATKSYYDWNRAGRPFRRSTWLAEIKALALAAGVPFLGDLGNEAHLRADRPEDHTPYSYTAWPIPLPDYVVCAIDLGDGPWSDRILADARAGRLPWLKYLNFRRRNYSRRRDNFREGTYSGDSHLHLSGMSNHTWIGLDGYNPFVAPAPPRVTNAGNGGREVNLYHLEGSKPTLYALAGDSPGTPANWLETRDYEGLAVPWARNHGNSILLSPPTWDEFRVKYLSPVLVVAPSGTV